jgi:hypothetical protein
VRKKIASLLVLSSLFALPGCASLPKKFIRKKAAPAHTPSVVYIEKGPYQKKYSNEYYYKTHYTLWRTWQDETLDNLNGNAKKLARSAQEAYSNLDQMSRYLKPEKQALLKPLLDEMKAMMDKLQTSNNSRSQTASMRTDLERIQRLVSNDFYYDKIKADILPDEVDLGGA